MFISKSSKINGMILNLSQILDIDYKFYNKSILSAARNYDLVKLL